MRVSRAVRAGGRRALLAAGILVLGSSIVAAGVTLGGVLWGGAVVPVDGRGPETWIVPLVVVAYPYAALRLWLASRAELEPHERWPDR